MVEIFTLYMIWAVASLLAGLNGGTQSAIYVIVMGCLCQLIKIVNILGGK